MRCAVCGKATRATPWSRSPPDTTHPGSSKIGPTAEGSVHAAGGGAYSVLLDDGSIIEASLRGRLKQESGSVVIGDRVSVKPTRVGGQPTEASPGQHAAGVSVAPAPPDAWTIESVRERSSELVRRGRGGRAAKVLAANLDRVFVVVAALEPPVTMELVDRLLVLVESSGIRPLLVINKLDLEGAPQIASELAELYCGLGYEALLVSAQTGEGLEELASGLCRGTSAMIGPSGVGKSSLLNALDPS